MRQTAIVAMLCAWGLACGGMPSSPTPTPSPSAGPTGNVAACEAWVAHHNALPCLPTDLDASAICAGLDPSPHDLSGYYGCLVEHARCSGNKADIDPSSCLLPR